MQCRHFFHCHIIIFKWKNLTTPFATWHHSPWLQANQKWLYCWQQSLTYMVINLRVFFLPAAEQVYKSFFSFSFFFFSFSNPRFFGLITILNQFMWLLTSRELWFSGKCDFPVKMWFPGKIWNSGKNKLNSGKKLISRENVKFREMWIPRSDFLGKFEIPGRSYFREEVNFQQKFELPGNVNSQKLPSGKM